MSYVRKTSRETFDQIRRNGLLSQRRWEVYEYVYRNGPCTGQEVFRGLRCQTNQSGRLTEMRDMGVLYEYKEDACPVTGRKVIFWATTNNVPIDLDKGKTKLERCRIALKKSEDRNHRLERLLKNVYALIEEEGGKEELAGEVADELGIPRPLKQMELF